MVKLGVNIDHIATLRQARKEGIPDIIRAVEEVKFGGADSVTVHLRQDRRHIQDDDVYSIKRKNILPLNLELAVREEIIKIALDVRPRFCCLVPENRQELTTEGGLNVKGSAGKIKEAVERLKASSIEVSLFIDPSCDQIESAARTGADAVEIHTGAYANASGAFKKKELDKLRKSAHMAREHGFKVNAGHGLDYENVGAVRKIEGIYEMNIGYSIVCRSVFTGLRESVRKMKELIE